MKKIYNFFLMIPVVAAMALATSCVDPAPAPDPEPEPEPTVKVPTISLKENIQASTYNAGGVTATVANADKIIYTHYLRDERPEDAQIEWVELVVDKDGEFAITISDLPTSLTAKSVYTVEAYACLVDEKSEVEKANFGTQVATPVVVSDMKVSPRAISFVATILTEYCDAYVVKIASTADFAAESFLADIEEGYETIHKEDAVVLENSWGGGLEPGKAFTIAIQSVNLTEDGKFKEMAGDMQIIETTTLDYELNQSEATVTMTIDPESITFANAKAKIVRADDQIGGCFNGSVKKSELGEKTIEAYISEIDWFYNKGQYDQENFRTSTPFYVPTENETEVTFNSLDANTEYVLFAIAYDKNGFVGKVVSQTIKTVTVAFEDPATVAITLTPGKDNASVEIEYKNNCQIVYYIKSPKKDGLTLEEARNQLVANSIMPFADQWNKDMVGAQTIYGLESDTEYDLFMLPQSDKGKFGKVMHQTFTTLSNKLIFDGASTMTVQIADPEGRLNRNDVMVWYYPFTPILANGAVSYKYGTIDAEDVVVADGESGPTAKDCAQLIHQTSGLLSSEGLEETEFSLYNYRDVASPYYCVFIPVDADGKLGTPVMSTLQVPEHTVKPSDKPDEPGVDPKKSQLRR